MYLGQSHLLETTASGQTVSLCFPRHTKPADHAFKHNGRPDALTGSYLETPGSQGPCLEQAMTSYKLDK